MVKKTKLPDNTIALNRKARHDYLIEQTFEAGLVLQGWEVKSLRAGRCQISESHIIIKRGEAWLLGSQVTPLPSASTHMENDPSRTRKLLLNRGELDKLIGHVEQKGYTLVPLKLYWKKGRAKLDLALAKGKKAHDKRAALKERDWQREKSRLGKN